MTERQERAARLRQQGLTFREIGQAMGVTAARASQMVAVAQRREEQKDHWTAGLSTHIRNALLAKRFRSRAEVEAALEVGAIAVRTDGRGTIPTLGRKGIAELRQWVRHGRFFVLP
ncbi:MAG: hypothetical protein ACREWE_14725 [Gammaproteobacteria bacterium]